MAKKRRRGPLEKPARAVAPEVAEARWPGGQSPRVLFAGVALMVLATLAIYAQMLAAPPLEYDTWLHPQHRYPLIFARATR